MGNACSKGSWRKPDPRLAWTPEFRTTLIQEIKRNSQGMTKKPCLLFVGPTSAGKSSVINTLLSAGTNHIVQKAEAGTHAKSFTIKFTRYDGVGELKNTYRICDTIGYLADKSEGLRDGDIVEVIRGHVSAGYEFQDDKDISEKDLKYLQVPADQDKSHCLVIILDSTKELTQPFKEKVNLAIRAARDEDIRTAIVLTKMDRLCVHVMKDTSRVFTCNHAKDIVTKTSELFGLPESKIFPMINYSSQVSKHEASPVDIIALLTLQKLLRLSYDYQEGNEFN